MANLSEDIQCAKSDTRPPMLDWTGFALRATNIKLQGLLKDIYTLINHYTDAKDIWDNVKMLLEGSELTKEDRELQLVVVLNVQGRHNRGQGTNPRGGGVAGMGEFRTELGMLIQVKQDRKHDEIERKNLLIANDNLIVECLSKEVFSVATYSELNVTRFTELHVANTIVEARCLELEAELSTLRNKSHNDNHNELVNWFSNLEKTNDPVPPSTGVNRCTDASGSQQKVSLKNYESC
nr:integrase, catalytic region, zinc finger, CCHC-type, peptidase aspartic, catalytic [Tanacetum cinerariifolium]